MKNYCAFSKDHKCLIWMNYEMIQFEIEEANSLCHGNWIEIERQHKYIKILQQLLAENGIQYPNEL